MPQKKHKVFYGWWIVGILLFISAYFIGIIYFSFTALIDPIVKEFGWSYAQVSFAMSFRSMEMGLLAPVIGLLIDRFGARKLLLIGIAVCGLGLFALSRINSLLQLYLVFILIASGTSACSGVIPMTVVGNWFRKKVSIATGIVVCGSAVGGLLIPLTTMIVDKYGWRTAMVIIAVIAWVVFLPVSLLVRHRPEQYGYLPDGDTEEKQTLSKALSPISDDEVSVSVKQAIRTRAFWHVSLTFMCHMLITGAVVTHVMPYLTDIGIARSTASFLAVGIPLMTIIGRLGFGWFGDKYDKRWTTAAAFLLLGAGLIIFNNINDAKLWLLILFLVIFGIGYGGPVPMMAALPREYFGRAKLGTIIGFVMGLGTLGSIAGPPLAGWIFDTLGSYRPAWYILTGISMIGLISIVTSPSLDTLKKKINSFEYTK
jgi:MFS family permease